MKKIINIVCLSFLLLTAASPLYAQKESGKVFRGNKEYEKQDYTAAEVEYRRGIEANKESFEAHYNLGNALFRQEKYPEAQAEFEKAASLLPKEDKANRAATFHNIGNAFFAQEQYENAIEAYKSERTTATTKGATAARKTESAEPKSTRATAESTARAATSRGTGARPKDGQRDRGADSASP